MCQRVEAVDPEPPEKCADCDPDLREQDHYDKLSKLVFNAVKYLKRLEVATPDVARAPIMLPRGKKAPKKARVDAEPKEAASSSSSIANRESRAMKTFKKAEEEAGDKLSSVQLDSQSHQVVVLTVGRMRIALDPEISDVSPAELGLEWNDSKTPHEVI